GAVALRAAEQRGVDLGTLVEPVDVGLPGEADAAVGLDRAGRHVDAGARGTRLRHRSGLRERLRIGVSRPSGEGRGRAGLLGFEQHLRAAVGDGLVGADGDAELLAVLDVLDGHLKRAVADPDELRADRHERAAEARAGALAERLAVLAGADAGGRSGRVDGVDGAHLGFLGAQHAPGAVLLDEHEQAGLAAADHELGGAVDRRAESADRLPAGEARQPARLLLGGPVLLDQGRRHRAGQERDGRERAAELLAEDRELDLAEALAAVLLGDRDPGPAELAELGPEGVVVRPGLGVLAHLRGARASRQQLAGGALDLALVVGQAEVHQTATFRRGRPSTRSATMFLSTSVVPPSIVLPRARRNS